MRLCLPAIALSVCVGPCGEAAAASPGDAARTHAPGSVPAAATPAAATAGEDNASDAAARHAKRTACVKQARTRKIVGTDKNTFIKNCVAAR
jgi:hypothetical protein